MLAQNGGKISLKLLSEIVAARLPVAIINSLLPVAILLFATFFLSFEIGLLAAILYSINPLALGVDRFIVHDSFLTLFSFSALGLFLFFGNKRQMSVWPGFFLGLAFLTKPNGILPITGWLVFTLFNWGTKKVSWLLLANLISTFVTVLVLWPASWQNPFAFVEYLYRQTTLVSGGMQNFYWGEVTNNPGPSYFIFQLTTKLPEMQLLNHGAVMAEIYGQN